MIKINTALVAGFEPSIVGMRRALESYEKSDSVFYDQWSGEYHDICGNSGPYDSDRVSIEYELGENDLKLMNRLGRAGSEHAKYRRAIIVWAHITAPMYWWKEFDTYKVGTVRLSDSTMHNIHKKEFTLDDFSPEHLFTAYGCPGEPDVIDSIDVVINGTPVFESSRGFLITICDVLNHYRKLYLETKDKKYWWQMIQLLPSSYNQTATVVLNYEVLANMYHQRKDHKLDEWRDFCNWIEALPYAKEIITMGE